MSAEAAAAPGATYRLQLTPSFGFDEAAAVTDYLAELGVTHLYSSPVLQPAPGSTHGYDVVDHHHVNVELGGADGHARLSSSLREAGLGQVLDIVPNHMAIGTPDNRWWWDVLENGPSSVYASYFDVDWDPPESKLRNTVLLPVLGDHYGRVLEAGELALHRDGGSFTVSYYDNVWPVAPRSLDTLLASAASAADSDALESIAAAFGRLPHSTATDRESVRERHRDKEVLRTRLAQLCEDEPDVAAAIDTTVAAATADADVFDALLERQNYRLAFWRTAGRELDYRRFFDINTLIGLRVEDPAVFDDTHEQVLQWVHEGVIDGLRIDHPDGLRDPEGYLERLAEAAGGTWIVVEKILEQGERLPEVWPVAGTTGYDFLVRLNALMVDPAGAAPLTAFYGELTGDETDYAEVLHEKKRQVMRDVLAADLIRLTNLFATVCERHRRYRDHTRSELHEALEEVIADFPVYRTYVRPGEATVRSADEADVAHAVAEAKRRRSDLDADLLDFLADLLLLRVRAPGSPLSGDGEKGEADLDPESELVLRFQQVTGPVMAKGAEDTAFYTYNRFVALNEVGGDPGVFGIDVADFHAACLDAQRQWPTAMLASSTHDTKRSEDVRARLAVLSEVPDAWAGAVRRWVAGNERHRGADWADPSAEYLLYQVLVGAWPLSAERATAYMEKATKEAKVHTSWIDPAPDYDDGLRAFVEGVLGDEAFVTDVGRFVNEVVERPGRSNSLAAALVKLMAPGVPDIYQGCEVEALALVDPDNRRPVDFAHRRALLAEVKASAGLLGADDDGAIVDADRAKLLVVHRALDLRLRRPEAFGGDAGYLPLIAGGPHADRVVAFARTDATGSPVAVTVVRRLPASGGQLDGTPIELPSGGWHDLCSGRDFDGGAVDVGRLLAGFPVALLEAR